MSTAQKLNLLGAILFIVSLLFGIPILIYLSIAFILASIIYWRVKSNKKSENEWGNWKNQRPDPIDLLDYRKSNALGTWDSYSLLTVLAHHSVVVQIVWRRHSLNHEIVGRAWF